jgi:formylmethanofuran dehydrogenase subunit E
MKPLDELLRDSATHHHRICPRQVLGARAGMLAASLLDLDLPQSDKRLLAITETDGCFVDGVSTATGCYVGRRTLRVEDFGKTAATFVDTRTERAVRIAPRLDVRELAKQYAPNARNRWEAQLLGYQRMPDEDLLDFKWVIMRINIPALIGQAGVRVNCDVCGEEIINQREVIWDSKILCRACAGQAYFCTIEQTVRLESV